ncbi:MAG TPA: glycosyltransferase family 2 protein [Glycomyces sp.]
MTLPLPRIHLVSFVGDSDAALLPHLVDHYRSLGVESFFVIRQVDTVDSPAYERIGAAAEAADIELFHTHVGPWSLQVNQRLVRFAMTKHPRDWFIAVDGDEFQVYDRPLHELIERCESAGATHVNGCFLDRIGPEGTLPEIGAGPLWDQFPLAGSVSAGLLRALPLKVGIARGDVALVTGQHGTAHGRGLPRSESFIQVHHFKWTASAVERVARRVERMSAHEGDPIYRSIIKESMRFLDHVRGHGGRFDTADPRFRLRECGSEYGDHPEWKAIAEEAQQWRWATA